MKDFFNGYRFRLIILLLGMFVFNDVNARPSFRDACSIEVVMVEQSADYVFETVLSDDIPAQESPGVDICSDYTVYNVGTDDVCLLARSSIDLTEANMTHLDAPNHLIVTNSYDKLINIDYAIPIVS